MKKYQVISRDTYGTTIILQTSNDLESAIKRIRTEVTNANFENALTTDDKYRTIEAYFPVFVDDAGSEVNDLVYAGNNTDGKHRAYRLSKDGSVQLESIDAAAPLLVFIGMEGGENRYLQDTRRKQVKTLKHDSLEGKTHYYIKVLV